MPDYEFIGKSRLWRGYSYPMKRSIVDRLLNQHEVASVTGVAYCEHSADQRVLSAHYSGPKSHGLNHTLTLWFNAVPSLFRHRIATRLQEVFIESLLPWCSYIADPDLLAGQLDYRFNVHYSFDVADAPCCLRTEIVELKGS